MHDGPGLFKVSSTERQVLGALGSIGVATLASRVLGFVRDMVVALAFGAGPVTDAFFVAFRIPNILRRLLAEGALATAVIPVFTEYAVAQPREALVRMLRAVLAGALLAVGLATVVGMLTAPWLVAVIAPGFSADAGQHALAVQLTRVMFPYLVLVGMAAFAMGVLNSQGRFFAAALGPAVLNVGMIATVLALASRLDPPILALAIGVLIGGVGQLLVQVPGLSRLGLLVTPSSELGHPALGRVARLLVPAVVGLAAVQVMVFVNTLLASLLAPGSISFLYYADRVMEFPLGVFGIALASASLPAMSRQAAAGDTEGVASTLNFALRLAAYVSLPATVGLVALNGPIIRLLFERGRFGPAETEATAAALIWYAPGLAGFAGARITAQAFYAIGAPGTAVRMGALSILANLVAAVVLMGPMGHTGLAAAASVGAYVNLGGLLWAARRRFGPLGGRALARSLVRTALACVPLAVWCALALGGAPLLGVHSTARLGVWLAITIGGGAAVFWACSALLGSTERTALAGMLPRPRPR
jgi:putative peptidoglycan lipid II flippase